MYEGKGSIKVTKKHLCKELRKQFKESKSKAKWCSEKEKENLVLFLLYIPKHQPTPPMPLPPTNCFLSHGTSVFTLPVLGDCQVSNFQWHSTILPWEWTPWTLTSDLRVHFITPCCELWCTVRSPPRSRNVLPQSILRNYGVSSMERKSHLFVNQSDPEEQVGAEGKDSIW